MFEPNMIQMLNCIRTRLKRESIQFIERLDDGCILLHITDFPQFPKETIEAAIWFYPNAAEVRCYYTERGAKIVREHKENFDSLLRLINYMNANVWIYCSDGVGGQLYAPSLLHSGRFYVDEDGHGDIVLTTMINYDVYKLAPLETENYIIGACPELLNDLKPAIFSLLLGKMDVEEAKASVRKMLDEM